MGILREKERNFYKISKSLKSSFVPALFDGYFVPTIFLIIFSVIFSISLLLFMARRIANRTSKRDEEKAGTNVTGDMFQKIKGIIRMILDRTHVNNRKDKENSAGIELKVLRPEEERKDKTGGEMGYRPSDDRTSLSNNSESEDVSGAYNFDMIYVSAIIDVYEEINQVNIRLFYWTKTFSNEFMLMLLMTCYTSLSMIIFIVSYYVFPFYLLHKKIYKEYSINI